MLFVHDAARVCCMWMQNTLVPLTAAFLDGEGRILGLADMEPLTTNGHCSPAPARYVLEMNRGWFARHGVGPGLRIDLTGGVFSAFALGRVVPLKLTLAAGGSSVGFEGRGGYAPMAA